LTPPDASRISAEGWIAAATSQKAAAEGSVGTRSSIVCTPTPPSISIVAPPSLVIPERTGTPRALSIRSV